MTWWNRKDQANAIPPFAKELRSAHAQAIGPVEIGENAKVGAAAVVVADVPSEVTVVGIPAKIVRVHGKKDAVIHEVEEKREYYVNKLEQAKEAVTDRRGCRGYHMIQARN